MYPASQPGSKRHTLSVLVENRPGVLARIAGLFARRAFNINSLSVSPTERPDISRVTVTADVEAVPLEQIIKQLNKLLHVLKIVELDPNTTVERELVLIKVAANESNRSDVLEIVRLHAWIWPRESLESAARRAHVSQSTAKRMYSRFVYEAARELGYRKN